MSVKAEILEIALSLERANSLQFVENAIRSLHTIAERFMGFVEWHPFQDELTMCQWLSHNALAIEVVAITPRMIGGFNVFYRGEPENFT